MFATIDDPSICETDYSSGDSILAPHQDHSAQIEDMRVLVKNTSLNRYYRKAGRKIQGLPPWMSDERSRRVKEEPAYTSFLRLMVRMFDVEGTVFRYQPWQFVDIDGSLYRCTSHKELMEWQKKYREDGRFTPWILKCVLRKMEAYGVISRRRSWNPSTQETKLFIRLNPRATLALFEEAMLEFRGEVKIAPKTDTKRCEIRQKPDLNLRGKRGRFVTSTRLSSQRISSKKDFVPSPSLRSPTPSSVFPLKLVNDSCDESLTFSLPTAKDLALPDPRLAELQKLEQAMRYHFPGDAFSPEQLKSIKSHFNSYSNSSTSGSRLTVESFQRFRDCTSNSMFQCSLAAFLHEWPTIWQQVRIFELQQQGYFDSHTTLQHIHNARSDFDAIINNQLCFLHQSGFLPARIDDNGLDILVRYEICCLLNWEPELTELVTNHCDALSAVAKQAPLEALYLQDLHPDFGSSVSLTIPDWVAMKRRIDKAAEAAMAQAMELHSFVTHGMREPLMLEILRSEERLGIKL